MIFAPGTKDHSPIAAAAAVVVAAVVVDVEVLPLPLVAVVAGEGVSPVCAPAGHPVT